MRLDKFLAAQLAQMSRRQAKRLIKEGKIGLKRSGRAVAGSPYERLAAAPASRLAVADRVEIRIGPDAWGDWPVRPAAADAPPLQIVACADAFVVVDKEAGVRCVPHHPAERATLAGRLAAAFPECVAASGDGGGLRREGGLCHRLDNQTSGLLIAARTPAAYRHLRAQFKNHTVRKRYLALASGRVPTQGTLTWPIVQHGRRQGRVSVHTEAAHSGQMGEPKSGYSEVQNRGQSGKQNGASNPAGRPRRRLLSAHTDFRRLGLIDEHSLVELCLTTGRRHQVRAHLAVLGHPLVGDTLYGGPACNPYSTDQTGFLLRATELELVHPQRNVSLRFVAPPHPLWQTLLCRAGHSS